MFWGGVRARLKSPPSWPTLPSSTGAAAMEVNEVCGEPKPGVVAVSMFCWENGGIKKNTEKTHGEGEKWKAFEETDERGEESSMSIGRLFHQKDPRFP